MWESFRKIDYRDKKSGNSIESVLYCFSDNASVSLYFFGEVSVIGVFLNLIVLPTVGILLGCGVLGMLLGCVSIKIAGIAIFPGRMLACFYEKMCRLAGNLPVCTWIAGRPQIMADCGLLSDNGECSIFTDP